MYRIRMAVLCMAVLIAFVNYSDAGEVKAVTCTGKIIDAEGRPIAGTKVGLYEFVYGGTVYSFETKLVKEIITKNDGAFSFTKENESGEYRNGVILARKQGLALGWTNWRMREDKDFEIKLGEAKELSGIVADNNDKPITEAEVSIYMLVINKGDDKHYLASQVASSLLTVKTGPKGRFRFTSLPAEATAEFIVKKKGRATINTWRRSSAPLTYASGQSNIKLVLPAEAKVEGIVVEKETGKSVADVQMIAMQDRNRPSPGQEPVTSRIGGTFVINSLTAGRHLLQLVPPREGLADWVAEPVEVTAEAGRTKEVRIEVTKGGLLEVVITEVSTKKPVEEASVSIRCVETDQWYNTRSDKDGLARIRLVPGEYQIQGVHKESYSKDRRQNDVTVEANKTARLEVFLTSAPKVTGVVRDKAGNPVEAATIKICPVGHRDITSDSAGRFEIEWNPRQWGPEEMVYYLVVRHLERNLAGAVEIDEDIKTIDIKLDQGVTFAGKVVDAEGKPIPGAKVNVNLRVSRWGSSITNWQRGGAVTDAKGEFKVKAIPPEHKYSVQARADGYGKKWVEVYADDAEDNRLDVGQFSLALADLSVSGIVVDVNDKPVAGANIYAYGNIQPDHHDIQTDAEGKFKIDKVCDGKIQLNANVRGKNRLHGYVETEGGATDVKIVVTESGSGRRRFVPKQPPSLAGKALPEYKGIRLQIDPNQIENKKLLVCFWDMQQRPSRHCIKELAKQAEQLKEKGVNVIAIQALKADTVELNQWVKKYNIPFTVGMIEADEEKTRFAWGVRALPWLIFTDEKHIIQAEGFGLNEVEDKMKRIINK